MNITLCFNDRQLEVLVNALHEFGNNDPELMKIAVELKNTIQIMTIHQAMKDNEK
jgi:hypothetical protein